jgi:hypothetical protein
LAAGIEYVAAQTQLVENLPWKNYIYGNNGFYYTDHRARLMTESSIRKKNSTILGYYYWAL